MFSKIEVGQLFYVNLFPPFFFFFSLPLSFPLCFSFHLGLHFFSEISYNSRNPGNGSSIRFLSWNIKGMGNPVKRSKVFTHLKRHNTDIAFLQETIYVIKTMLGSHVHGPETFFIPISILKLEW